MLLKHLCAKPRSICIKNNKTDSNKHSNVPHNWPLTPVIENCKPINLLFTIHTSRKNKTERETAVCSWLWENRQNTFPIVLPNRSLTSSQICPKWSKARESSSSTDCRTCTSICIKTENKRITALFKSYLELYTSHKIIKQVSQPYYDQ